MIDLSRAEAAFRAALNMEAGKVSTATFGDLTVEFRRGPRGRTFACLVRFTSPEMGKRRSVGVVAATPLPSKWGDFKAMLARADREADSLRDMVRRGVDPIEQRLRDEAAAKARAEAAKGKQTFAEAAREYLTLPKFADNRKEHDATARALLGLAEVPRKTAKTTAFVDRLTPEFRARPVDEITAAEVRKVLAPHWGSGALATSRLLGHVVAVIGESRKNDDSDFDPATWRRIALKARSPEDSRNRKDQRTGQMVKLEKGERAKSHPAARLDDAPEIAARLWADGSTVALATLFAMASGQRAGSVAGLQWSEIVPAIAEDRLPAGSKVWAIPAARQKARRSHRLPVSGTMLMILNRLGGTGTGPVFPSPRQAAHVSPGAMRDVLTPMAYVAQDGRPISLHGFRGTLMSWLTVNRPADRVAGSWILHHADEDIADTTRHYVHGVGFRLMLDVLNDYGRFLLPL